MEQRNLTLLTDLYELTMMQGYFKEKDANETVVFDMFYRTNPTATALPSVPDCSRSLSTLRTCILMTATLNT